jgi:hypothetical protein
MDSSITYVLYRLKTKILEMIGMFNGFTDQIVDLVDECDKLETRTKGFE